MKSLNLPIKWKLTIWHSSILALILVVFSSFVYVYLRNSLMDSIDTKIKSIADVLSSSLTDTRNQTIFGNFERYLENVFGRKPKGKFIQIIDPSGKIGAKMNDTETEVVPVPFSTFQRGAKGEIVYETVENQNSRT